MIIITSEPFYQPRNRVVKTAIKKQHEKNVLILYVKRGGIMKSFLLLILFSAVPFFLGAQDQQQNDNAAPAQKKFGSAQLEQLVAPIALYPDSLLAQVLAASTYPVDIVEAARWVKHNPDLSQDDFKNEVQNKSWDPSVKGLVFFPQLLAKMNDNLDWTTDLGNAFLSQQQDVMDTVQIMRAKAQDVGTLKTDPNQNVTAADDGSIQIQSADPNTVYVQNYVPSTAYGSSWTSDNNNGYYPDVIIAPVWPWGCYGGGWALGFNCYWGNHGWIGYNNNYYNNHGIPINPNRRNPNVVYDPRNPNALDNRPWSHNDLRSRAVTPSTQQIARQLETEKRAPQDYGQFKGYDERASSELRTATDNYAKAEPARYADAQRVMSNTAQDERTHAFGGSGDGEFERQCSERGNESFNNAYHYSGGSSYHGGAYHGGGHGGGRR